MAFAGDLLYNDDMTGMTYREPRLQQQINQFDPYGGKNCTAYCAAMAADADSRGKYAYTGAQVRRSTNEPYPDPDSPGLTLGQVDTALYKMSGGDVNLDVHYGISDDTTMARLRAGQWAIVQVQRSVLRKYGYGEEKPFGAGHAIIAGYRQTDKVPIIGDPLISYWMPLEKWSHLFEAAGQLVIRPRTGERLGYGRVYAAFTRDVYSVSVPTPVPSHYNAFFEAGSFWLYTVVNGVITKREARRFEQDTSAPCTAATFFPWPGNTQRRLARILKGVLAGSYVEPGSTNVVVRAA